MFIFLIFSFLAHAGEPDNFAYREGVPQNKTVNEFIQKKLEAIAEKHNQKNSSTEACNKKQVDYLLEEELDKNWPEVYGLLKVVQFTYGKKKQQSVLRGRMNSSYFMDSVILNLQGKPYAVGIDKIDHLFAHGNMYWHTIGKDPSLPKKKVLKALGGGENQENGAWGLSLVGPGQKSYGDLSANYQGLYFWRDIWNGKPSFFTCSQGKIATSREFKIEDYLTPAVDEAINCNSYRSKEMAETIVSRTEALKLKCPISPDVCKELMKSTPKEYQARLLHPLCRGEVSDQVETAGDVSAKDIVDGLNGISRFIMPKSPGRGIEEQLGNKRKGAR